MKHKLIFRTFVNTEWSDFDKGDIWFTRLYMNKDDKSAFGVCQIPELYPSSARLKTFKKLNRDSDLDYRNKKFIKVEVKIILPKLKTKRRKK